MNLRMTAFLCALGMIALSVTAPTDVRAQASGVDPAAVDTLRRMTDYTGSLKQFSVHTESTLEDLLDSGQRIDFDVAASVTVRRPNQLRAERIGELISQVFYYDGKSLTLYNPTDGLYATEPAPETIEELIDYTRESLGMLIPVSDLVYRNSFAILMQGVTDAFVVGKAVIGGVSCDHIALSRPDIDIQVWVAEGDQPLPCKYVVTDTSTPENVSTVTVMSDWNVTPAVSAATFRFVPPSGAKPISFMPLDETGDFGR